MKGVWVTIETCFNSSRPLVLVLKVIKTVAAVAVGAELTVGKTLAVAACKQTNTHINK